MAEIKMYELIMAEKRHETSSAKAKHMNRNNLHISNLRLIKGKPYRVNEWWFLKNQPLLRELVKNGQLIINMPDGSTLGAPDVVPAKASPPSTIPETAVPEVQPMAETDKAATPESPDPEPVEDDFSILPLKEMKVRRLKEVAKTYADVLALDVVGLVEKAGLSPAQAEKVLNVVRSKVE